VRRRNGIANQVAIAGVGYSELGRNTGKTEGHLAMQAILNAVSDAGLQVKDVDGLACYPDRVMGSAFEGPSISYVQRSLGLERTNWFQAMGWGPAQISAIHNSIYAIAGGGADIVVAWRAHLRQEHRFVAHQADVKRPVDDLAFKAPYGVPAGTPRWAMWAARHMHKYGTTTDHLFSVVKTCRDHAQMNPRAVWYGHPITREDYYEAPMISSPLRILDCDMPIDGAVAIVLVSAARIADTAKKPVWVNAVAHATGSDLDFDQWPDLADMASKYIGEQLWAGTDLTPADVDVAELYDGFSFMTLCWFEDLGFGKPGEAGDFFQAGKAHVGGELPCNTDGGQLGMGRLHGLGKVGEAVQQLRGECGERQVAGAKVAVAAAGGGPIGAALLLTI
jgi:acetyl-CoA acetyltransferase